MMSMVLMVLSVTILFTLWLRDRTVMCAILQGAEAILIQEDESWANLWIQEKEGSLFVCQGELEEISRKSNSSSLSWKSGEFTLFPGVKLSFSQEMEASLWDPPSLLYSSRLISGVISAE